MDWETEKKSQTRRFWLGVFAGSLAAIFVLAGIWCVWQISGRTARGDFASGEISERDVEDKLDQINGLIERYYLYEDEIDEDALIDGIYSRLEIHIQSIMIKRKRRHSWRRPAGSFPGSALRCQ